MILKIGIEGLFVAAILLSNPYTLRAAVPDPSCTLPQWSLAVAGEADRLLNLGRLHEALRVLARSYTLCPPEPTAIHTAAVDRPRNEVYERARRKVDAEPKSNQTSELHLLVGEIERLRGDEKSAALEDQIAAQMNPNETNLFTLATALARLNLDAAATIDRYGISVYPKSVKLRVALAMVLYAQGSSEEGARLLCQAADIDPADPHPMEFLADTGIVPVSVRAEVVSRLAALSSLYPRDGLVLFDYTMAKSGRWSGDKEAAPPGLVASLKAALALDPGLSKAYFELARIYEKQGNYSDEIVALNHAVTLSPHREQYHYRLALAYRRVGNLSAYQEEMKRYAELHGPQAP